ncbi:hypothetical protein D3C77_680810 [compost metagenome]
MALGMTSLNPVMVPFPKAAPPPPRKPKAELRKPAAAWRTWIRIMSSMIESAKSLYDALPIKMKSMMPSSMLPKALVKRS